MKFVPKGVQRGGSCFVLFVSVFFFLVDFSTIFTDSLWFFLCGFLVGRGQKFSSNKTNNPPHYNKKKNPRKAPLFAMEERTVRNANCQKKN